MSIGNQARLERYRRSRKPLCTDSLLLAQEVWHGEKEITAILRISRSALYRWMKQYNLPVAYMGKGLILSKGALSDWCRRIAIRQNSGTTYRRAKEAG
jgi:hypothetical protein